MSEIPFAVHNPALLPADVLLGEFTARGPLLKTLLRIVRGNVRGKPPQHAVLVGARGMGKTTTLWAVAHSISGDSELTRQWQPVVFDEESRRVGDLADFWLEAIRQWELATHSSDGQAERLLANAGEDLEARARSAFLAAVDRGAKRAVLLIDNLNDVFASISEPEALHRLRAFLMEDDRIMILGAATRHFDAITGLDEPFFDFFRIFELSPLTLEEMRSTLLTLAERRSDTRVAETIEQRPGTIRSLHVLTGGNPRLIKTFYRLLAEGLRGDVRQDLERLVDEFTPYFKAILDALPLQQQRIIDAVALAWEPVEVATIARATRLPSNQVSAQLRSLVRSGIAAEAAGNPKRKTYLLADRFSNIHYLMRHGRTARRRFDWFVLTLRALFPDPEQADALARVAGRTASAGDEGLRDTRDLLSCALSHAESEESRRRILQATFKETWNQETLATLSEWLDLDAAKRHVPSSSGELDIVAFFAYLPGDLRRSLGYQPEDSHWWFGLTEILRQKEAWVLAEAAYRKAIELEPAYSRAWHGLALLLDQHFVARRTEAESAYRKTVEFDPNSSSAWNRLGTLLGDVAAYSEAEAVFRKALEIHSGSHQLWHNLGIVLRQKNLFDDAEVAYRRALEIDAGCSDAWNSFGMMLARTRRLEEAEAAFRKALELNPKSIYAWNSLGLVLEDFDHRHEAEAAFRQAILLDKTFAAPHSNLARLWIGARGKTEEAREAAITGLTLDPSSASTRRAFISVCDDSPTSWQIGLPIVAAKVAADPRNTALFDFAFNGFIRYAQLTSAAEAAKLLDTITECQPFETLSDAFRVHSDREHLHQLAPERRALILEILNRIEAKPVEKTRKERTRKPTPKLVKRKKINPT